MNFNSSYDQLVNATSAYKLSVYSILEKSLEKFISKYPNVAVGWQQTTQWDGEDNSWEFAVDVFKVFVSEQDLVEFDGYTTSYYFHENFLIDYPHLGDNFWDDWVSLESFLAKIPKEIYEEIFGNDVRVNVTQKGILVESYKDHE